MIFEDIYEQAIHRALKSFLKWPSARRDKILQERLIDYHKYLDKPTNSQMQALEQQIAELQSRMQKVEFVNKDRMKTIPGRPFTPLA